MDEQDLLRKISGLLAKAEGTDNEHEANAFFEKAFDLMTRHAIDEARVREAQKVGNRPVEEPVRENYMFSSYAHHAEAKKDLLFSVAKHLSVRIFSYENRKGANEHLVRAAGLTGLYESQWCWLVGYRSDIEAMKLLFLSLLIQSQKFANDDWRNHYGDAKEAMEYDERYDEDRPIGKFAWIGSHMQGFASRIDLRFRALRESIHVEADSKALIVNKEADIQEWMYAAGFMRRPPPPPTTRRCYAVQPESDPDWPRTSAGKPNKKHRARYCIRPVYNNPTYNGLDDIGPVDGAHVDGNPAHTYTYDTGPHRYNYSVTIGRRESSVGRSAGSKAADRADIGLTRVGSNRTALRGGG